MTKDLFKKILQITIIFGVLFMGGCGNSSQKPSVNDNSDTADNTEEPTPQELDFEEEVEIELGEGEGVGGL